MSSCLICGSNAITTRQDNSSRTIYNCDKCGIYVISDLAQNLVMKHLPEISAYLRHRRISGKDDAILISFGKTMLDKSYVQLTVEQIVEQFPKNFREQMEKALMNLAMLSEYPGKEVVVDSLSSAAVFYLKKVNFDSLSFIIKTMAKSELIEVNYRSSAFFPCGVIVSAKGWDMLTGLGGKDESQRPGALLIHTDSGTAHAKAFRSAAQKAANECGIQIVAYDTLKMGGGYNGIDAQIKMSDYVLIDLSDTHPESLYALGYARALRKPLILTCHENERKKLLTDCYKIGITFWQDEKEVQLEIFNFIKASQ